MGQSAAEVAQLKYRAAQELKKREAPERAKAEAEAEVVRLLPLSAHHPEALKALAGGYAAALDDVPASDAVRTAATGRAPFRHRLAVTGTTASDLAGGLGAFTEGRFVEGLHTGTSSSDMSWWVLKFGHDSGVPYMMITSVSDATKSSCRLIGVSVSRTSISGNSS